jgi:transcriptional regulator with XRE-family HTH domain
MCSAKGGVRMIDEAFGAALRTVREERGLSREELAERLGAGNGKNVWRLESGKTDVYLSTVRRLAAALGVEPSQLLEDKNLR